MRKNKKSKQGLSRLLELAEERTSKLTLSILCSIAGTLCQLLPFWAAYQVMAELLQHAASGAALHVNFMFRWAFYGLIGLLVGYILTYIAGMMAHTLLGLDSDTFYIYHVAAVMVDNLRRLLLGINLSDKAIMDFDFPGVGFPV